MPKEVLTIFTKNAMGKVKKARKQLVKQSTNDVEPNMKRNKIICTESHRLTNVFHESAIGVGVVRLERYHELFTAVSR